MAYRGGRLGGDDLIPALLATMQPSLSAGQEPKPNPPPSPALARAGKPGETRTRPYAAMNRTVTCLRSPSRAALEVRIFSARCFGV
jgi:hypothetical protein